METEVLHVRFVVVEVEGKIRCCSYAMNRAMVVSADFRGQEVTEEGAAKLRGLSRATNGSFA